MAFFHGAAGRSQTMAFRLWQIGLEIQQDKIRALAMSRHGRGWRLRRWWQKPLPPGCIEAGRITDAAVLIAELKAWRSQLPLNYVLSMAFPAHRTLVRHVPAAASQLREPECETYVAGATARQLSMDPAALSMDYLAAVEDAGYAVTTARHQEVDVFQRCAIQARLALSAITPDASAVGALLPFLPNGVNAIAVWQAPHWYYASAGRWAWSDASALSGVDTVCQALGMPVEAIAWCNLPDDAHTDVMAVFDPWCVFTHLQPPLPSDLQQWAVPIGLALGSGRYEAA